MTSIIYKLLNTFTLEFVKLEVSCMLSIRFCINYSKQENFCIMQLLICWKKCQNILFSKNKNQQLGTYKLNFKQKT